MKEAIAEIIKGLSFLQIIGAMGFIVLCALTLIIGIAIAFDKLNIKSFSFRNGFTFYQDGDEKRSRITHRKKTVRRKTK